MTGAKKISKSSYCKGLICLKALYLYVHHYDLQAQPSPGAQARFDAGNRIGELARDRFAGGVLIEQGHREHDEAVAATLAALDAGAPAIFEAAFTHDGVRIRADVLRRLDGGGFELIEVKSTTKYAAEKHLADAGIQLHVLLGSGIDVRRVTLMHIDRTYVWDGGPYDPQALLMGTDITAEAFEYLACVGDNLAQMMEVLSAEQAPGIAVGSQCTSPYECSFLEYCTADQPKPDFSGDVERVDAVVRRLDDLPFPLHFVDFETVMPALPVFVGTRPYQVMKVQWSIHTLHANGTLTHAEWLVPAGTTQDPDSTFMRSLLDALGNSGTFIHYSPYERTQLVDIAARHVEFRQELVDRLPGLRQPLERKLATMGESWAAALAADSAGGLVDFDLGQRVVRDGCLHAQLPKGSYTIKTAIKLLARDMPPYEGLAVSNGDEAMAATLEMLDRDTDPRRAQQIRTDLLEYCKQDTLAMVEIYRALRT